MTHKISLALNETFLTSYATNYVIKQTGSHVVRILNMFEKMKICDKRTIELIEKIVGDKQNGLDLHSWHIFDCEMCFLCIMPIWNATNISREKL